MDLVGAAEKRSGHGRSRGESEKQENFMRRTTDLSGPRIFYHLKITEFKNPI